MFTFIKNLSLQFFSGNLADSIQILTALGTWLAAIAACFASGVSLWIATRKQKHKINIKVYSGFYTSKDKSHNGAYIRSKNNSETLNKFSNLEPMLEIIVENRGYIPFRIDALEIQINTQERITLNIIEHLFQEEIPFIRRIEPGESTTYFYRFCSLIATQELFELLLSEIKKKITPKMVIRTGFGEEASASMPKDFCKYILEHGVKNN